MPTEIIVVRFVEDGEIIYEVRDQDEQYLADADSLDAAVDVANEYAQAHNIEYVKIRVATESHNG
jgi:hypothetical protein